jgi:hypothetical protein
VKQIKLSVGGIVVETTEDVPKSVGGTITSDLKAGLRPKNGGDSYEACIDGIEALVLAHACAGVEIGSGRYQDGLQAAIDAVSNQYN